MTIATTTEGNCIMFYTFTRVDKRAFTKAYNEGQVVAMGRTSRDDTAETFLGSGFTKTWVADPFADTGRGGVLRYWVAVAGSETPAGPVEYIWHNLGSWGFYCADCKERTRATFRDVADAERVGHLARHAVVA